VSDKTKIREKVVEVRQVSKRYSGKTVLENVSFSVRAGTIHGFIGPNGAGKSTTLNISVRLVLPSGGEEYIEGKSVTNNPSFNENLGFIPAESRFISGMTVEEYIKDCGYLRDIPASEIAKKIANSPLAKFRYHTCSSLSTG
jgi:ABC-2 type transport system ATP-binding protein